MNSGRRPQLMAAILPKQSFYNTFIHTKKPKALETSGAHLAPFGSQTRARPRGRACGHVARPGAARRRRAWRWRLSGSCAHPRPCASPCALRALARAALPCCLRFVLSVGLDTRGLLGCSVRASCAAVRVVPCLSRPAPPGWFLVCLSVFGFSSVEMDSTLEARGRLTLCR